MCVEWTSHSSRAADQDSELVHKYQNHSMLTLQPLDLSIECTL